MHYSMVNEKRLSPKGTQIRAIKVVMIKRFIQHVAKDKINSRVGNAGVGEFRIHICCFFKIGFVIPVTVVAGRISIL